MGINQPKVSALLHRKLSGFSVERLMHFLNQLGQDIDIVVRPKPRNRKNARVNVFGYEGYSGASIKHSFSCKITIKLIGDNYSSVSVLPQTKILPFRKYCLKSNLTFQSIASTEILFIFYTNSV